MSLVYFHIFLISIGVVFAFFFGIWEFENFSTLHKTFDLAGGIVSFVFSFMLACYLVWFIRKKKPFMK